MRSEHVVDEAKRLIEEDRCANARDLLITWLEEHPDDGAAWAVLGAAEFNLKNFESAKDAAEKVTLLRPDNAQDWCNLGVILRKLRQLNAAAKVQRRALELDPAYERAREELTKIQSARRSQVPEPKTRRRPGVVRPPVAAEEPDPILEALSAADNEYFEAFPTWNVARGVLVAVGILSLIVVAVALLSGSPRVSESPPDRARVSRSASVPRESLPHYEVYEVRKPPVGTQVLILVQPTVTEEKVRKLDAAVARQYDVCAGGKGQCIWYVDSRAGAAARTDLSERGQSLWGPHLVAMRTRGSGFHYFPPAERRPY